MTSSYSEAGHFTTQDREKLSEVHTLVKSHIKLIDDHEKRLRKHEKFFHWTLGAAATLSAALTALLSALRIKLGQ